MAEKPVREFSIKKMRLKTLIIILSIVAFLFCLVLAKGVIENGKCSNNPFLYGTERITSQGEFSVMCSCDVADTDSSVRFWFDEKRMYNENPFLVEE